MLRLISIVLLIYSFFVIQTSIPTLPARIPTHFNAEGADLHAAEVVSGLRALGVGPKGADSIDPYLSDKGRNAASVP